MYIIIVSYEIHNYNKIRHKPLFCNSINLVMNRRYMSEFASICKHIFIPPHVFQSVTLQSQGKLIGCMGIDCLF